MTNNTDLIDIIDKTDDITTKIERTEFLLNEILQGYSFTGDGEFELMKNEADIWVHGYSRILQFVTIASEYIITTKESLTTLQNNLKEIHGQ